MSEAAVPVIRVAAVGLARPGAGGGREAGDGQDVAACRAATLVRRDGLMTCTCT